jgi:hypothetical protein
MSRKVGATEGVSVGAFEGSIDGSGVGLLITNVGL